MRGETKPPDRLERIPFDSVAALRTDQGGVVEHSEYIVYKDSQCLPEYAIWYKHASACRCTHCAR